MSGCRKTARAWACCAVVLGMVGAAAVVRDAAGQDATGQVAAAEKTAGELATVAEAPPIEHPPSVPPAQAEKLFVVPDDLAIRLVASEPELSQPLSISFDDRGRMWVLEYLQYPIPEGRQPVSVDQYLRTQYDTVPKPPPDGPKGRDRISIFQDTDGDGRAESVKRFVTDLNLASGMALAGEGVYVVQPPYLLFYADRDSDDVPDGDPEVLLSGFGMEDAHAFANSLTWGPDGWLYGAQGSTVTANIRGVEFQQGAWRYHPGTDRFELFAEGGGNSWGIEFDRFGNLFAAGNTVEPLVHHVQGAYYVKGFGKHGPLHNPHAYGYFQPVTHHGYAGDSLTGGAVLYQGGLLPERFNGACIAPNTRHSASRWSTVEVMGSTFATRAAGDFITTSDIWFRPVDSTVGPDGALYVADWYDYNISHSNPQNRSQWYMPSRGDGRIWRVAPHGAAAARAGSFDLAAEPSERLVELLTHRNDWYARQARRILGERRDASVLPRLKELLISNEQRTALQGLWSIHVTAGLDEPLALETLGSQHEYVRAWTVRLLGDAREVSPAVASRLAAMAVDETSVVVRSQLACTARRLKAEDGLAIVRGLLRHDEDAADPFVGLLIWWAIEDKAVSDQELVLALLEPEAWRRPLARQFVIERLARRYAAEGSRRAYEACARLLETAENGEATERVIQGFVAALSGRRLDEVPNALADPLETLLAAGRDDPLVVQLALRLGSRHAVDAAVALVQSGKVDVAGRVALVQALGEIRAERSIDGLLALLQSNEAEALVAAAVGALGHFDLERIAAALLEAYPRMAAEPKARAVQLLCGRREWAAALVEAVEAGKMDAAAVSIDQVRQMMAHGDERIAAIVAKHWGRIQPATPAQKQGRITAILQMLARGGGEAARGAVVFEKSCATCHKLHGKGQTIGPDLSGAERRDQEKLVRNIVDPSAAVRQEYIAHVVVTADGRVLTGLLADATPETITVLDAKNERTVLKRDELDAMEESPLSLMPERILDELSDQQIRDLVAYIQSEADVQASVPAASGAGQ